MLYIIKCGEDMCLVTIECNCVFVVSRWFAVFCSASPSVLLYYDVFAPEVNHRLDCYAHTVFENGSYTFSAIVWHFRVLVHFFAYSVSAHFTNYGVATVFAVRLDSICDVATAFATLALLYTLVKRFLGGFAAGFYFRSYIANGISVALVTVISVKFHNTIQSDYISFSKGIV